MTNNLFKKSSLTLIVAFLSLTVLRGQETESAATLFKKGGSGSQPAVDYFVTPLLGVTSFDGSTAVLLQARAGISINDSFSMGGYFSTSINEVYPQSEVLSNVYMDYWSAGGFMAFTTRSTRLIHWSFPLYFGYGEVEMDNEASNAGLGEANFFQVEPSALLHLNLTQRVRLTTGAGYRWVSETTYRGLDESDLAGLTAYFGFVIDLTN